MRISSKPAALGLAIATLLAGCAGIGGGDEPIDQAFIDMMVPHHESAIAMAEVAQERAEHDELRALAKDIVAAQSAEIARMRAWREEWFGSGDTPSMDQMPMLPGMSMPPGHSMTGGSMDMTAEVDDLRDAEPFDRFFIDAMIRHHEQAVEAAEIVLAETDREAIRELATAIIEAQTGEIERLRDWRAEWY